MGFVLKKVKQKKITDEILLNELESLYCLLKIAPDRNKVKQMIKERETILKKHNIDFSNIKGEKE